MTDFYLITGAQCRMARSLLKWSSQRLANEANVGRNTISTFEDDTPIRESIILDIQSVFDAYGVECHPDGSVKPRTDGVKDFRGMGGCDRFFANIEKMLGEKKTNLVCRIGSQAMLTRVTGRDGLNNFDRLQRMSELTHVRCLLSDQQIYLPATPLFDVRVFPENRPSIISSEFTYGEEAAFAAEQDPRFHSRHMVYMVIEYSNMAKKTFNYFERDWQAAAPYATITYKKATTARLDCLTPALRNSADRPRQQACS